MDETFWILMNKKENTQTYSIESFGMKAQAVSNKYLLFFQFQCPHCNHLNVMGKTNVQEYLICSNSTCRRVIILENYLDIA